MVFFKEEALISPKESQACLNMVDAMADAYIYETKSYFCTLGVPIYQHAGHWKLYQDRIAHLNKLLWSKFEWLYLKIKQFFESFLQAKVYYPAYHTSLPGFHIFEIGKKESYGGGSPHFDVSYKQIPFLGQHEDDDIFPEHYSFTLPLQLPASGSGIEIWDLEFSRESKQLSQQEKDNIAKLKPAHFPYQVGKLYVFNGHNYHRIAPIPKTAPADRRITLQGHIVKHENNYLIYW